VKKNGARPAMGIVAVLMAAAMVLCVGCTQAPEPEVLEQTVEYVYTEDFTRIMETYGSSYIINGKTMHAQVGGHTYVFPASFSEEERSGFIDAQETLCALLEEHGMKTGGLTFYAAADYPNRAESESAAAFFDISRTGSWEQALTTLQTVLGDYTNYGYLYALADSIASGLDWTRDEVSPEMATGFKYRAELLNLVYPCFDDFYTSKNNIERCKALALELIAGMDDPFAGEDAFIGAIEEYAAANKIDFTATYLRFAYNGESCPLKMLTERMEVLRLSSYDSGTLHKAGLVEEDPMATVGGLITTYEQLDAQLASIMDWLELEEAPVIPVQMSYPLPNDISGIYFMDGGLYVPYASGSVIYSSTVSVLAHEYTHYLYDLASLETDVSPAGGAEDPLYEGWMNEAIAYYCTLENDYQQRLLQAESGVGPSLEFLETVIGQAYDEPMDEVLYIRAALLDAEHPYPYYLKSTNKACAAFGEYFVRTYGEEAFFGCMLYPSYAEAFIGVTVDQVVDDWCEDMARGLELRKPAA